MKNLLILTLIVFAMTSMLYAGPDQLNTKSNKWESEWLNKLEHENVKVRIEAANKLSEAGVTQAKDKMFELVKNEESASARIAMIVAVTKISGAQDVNAFKDQLEVEKNNAVRNVLKGAIKQLESDKVANM